MTKYFHINCAILFAVLLIGCSDDDRLETVNVGLPENIDATFNLTQDNSGDVTIIPTADNANTFTIDFGDGNVSDTINVGSNVTHTFSEGEFDVTVEAFNLIGQSSAMTKPLQVSFNPPENLEVLVENDGVQSNTVNVTATADFASSVEVNFGEDVVEDSVVTGEIGETLTYTYQQPGIYTITVVVSGASSVTTTYTEEDFEVIEISEPTVPAPVPSQPAQTVKSIYSDAYDPINITEFPTEWSDSGFEEIQIEGDNIIKYANLAFTGIVTDYENPTDLTDMDYVRFDYWTPDATSLGFKLVNTTTDPAQEDIIEVGTPTQGEWVSVEIPLDDYDMDRSNVTQLLFDALGNRATVYIDNLYFYQDTPQQPTEAAPTPTQDEANVIAIYSDAYNAITLTELPTEWSGSNYEEISINGNSTMLFTNFDFLGIVSDYENPTDLSGMTHIHFDYWTPNAESLGIKIVNTNLDPIQEDEASVGDVTLGEWISVDIPLNDFDMDRSQVTQFIFDNLVPDDASATVYIDNFYFYN
ncbi:PKD domain-containing protein [Psychroflexus montanilacus]|uniref:PKD domain-containing protein n=1 Tax=Psychroflexus montanilacus TaxID=2873598 RepID=UPI001CCCA4A8|nr:PKD domain-containing protein [Psychroflexus montanilacus]MBZ9651701.1 PKD domain-containing protein [Psychroflexus montanilacus]